MNQQPIFNSVSARVLTVLCAVSLTGCVSNRPPRVVAPPGKVDMPPRSTVATPVPPPVVTIPVTRPAVLSTPAPSAPAAPSSAPRAGTPYTVKKGESLSAVAVKYGISWRELASYNRIADPNKVRAGQVLLIPAGAHAAPSTPAVSTPRPAAPAASGGKYVVQNGDSLWLVARRNNTTVKALKEANNLRSDVLKVGQTLVLPGGASTSSTVTAAPRATPRPSTPTWTTPTPVPTRPVLVVPTPTPRPLDTSFEQSFEATPAPTAAPSRSSSALDKAFPIVVEEGETLDDIARSYIVSKEEIRKLNNLPADAVLKKGQTLLIPPSVY